MNFTEMMEAIENGKLANRPGWGAAIMKNDQGLIIYVDPSDPEDDSYWSAYELEISDYKANDWVVVK